jgi:hypothetical protein
MPTRGSAAATAWFSRWSPDVVEPQVAAHRQRDVGRRRAHSHGARDGHQGSQDPHDLLVGRPGCQRGGHRPLLGRGGGLEHDERRQPHERERLGVELRPLGIGEPGAEQRLENALVVEGQPS